MPGLFFVYAGSGPMPPWQTPTLECLLRAPIPSTVAAMSRYYLTTPIYYVNDKPHIGHCFTTCFADVVARFQRLFGREVFFLTGTDEHADKVVSTAAEHGMSPMQWADTNARAFEQAFAALNISNDDFIRTTQPRHTTKVLEYIAALQKRGDIYLGDYTGWWDPSQEEYLTETTAKDASYKSPVTGKDLVKRTERNYFFKLSAYHDRLVEHLARNPEFILPESRRNEVLGRLRERLVDIPISRGITDDPSSQWGIRMPEDATHRIYVWIDALFNYLSVIDTDEKQDFWPPSAHLLAKDILWFHAVIWPCLLMALGRPLPGTVYAHGYFVRDGRKMSKSLGNFIDLAVINQYCAKYSADAFRWFLATQGPIGNNDADFSHTKFIEVYNADLANGIGNAISRVGNMCDKYFNGTVPDAKGVSSLPGLADFDWPSIISRHVASAIGKADALDITGALQEGVLLVKKVDAYINVTEPFKLAKKIAPGSDESPERDRLAAILYHCAEALRVATLLHSPAIPTAAAKVQTAWHCLPAAGATLAQQTQWNGAHSLVPGAPLTKGEILFMRAEPGPLNPDEPTPGAA